MEGAKREQAPALGRGLRPRAGCREAAARGYRQSAICCRPSPAAFWHIISRNTRRRAIVVSRAHFARFVQMNLLADREKIWRSDRDNAIA